MSTKAIRRMLDFVADTWVMSASGREALERVRKEVEAIEDAAKDLMGGRDFRGSHRTISTLVSIARDAP